MYVRRILNLLGAILFSCCSAQAATHTQARLVVGAEMARAGDSVLAGVHLKMETGWHTYWRNSGASGAPTKIDWELPKGVSAGPIQWPVPEKLPDEDLTTYVYKDEVVLLVPLKLSPEVPSGPLTIKAKVEWLECEVLCQRGNANLTGTVNVGTETKPSADAAILASWQKKLPQSSEKVSPHAWWENNPAGDLRSLILEWNSTAAASEADFFPDGSENFEIQPATERLPVDAKIRLRKQVKKLSVDWPARISGVAVQLSGNERIGFEVDVSVAASSATVAGGAKAASGLEGGIMAPSLWKMLVYAFLGGLILNVMPCVLPVIALKILGFVGQSRDDPRQVRRLGLIYALGVLASFLILAALVIGVKAAGHKAGWGMQFGNPQFLVLLTILVTLVALSLFGLFDINLAGRVMDTAATLSAKQGTAGAFFNGVLATILATPCTAPFLAPALGFAFAQSAGIVILMFLTVGCGLALPYVILSWNPAWLKFLPKPGVWMEKFKIAMGFPMLATALWLFSLLPLHYGERASWLGMFLVILALAAWVFGDFVQRGRARRGLAVTIALGLLVSGYFIVLEDQMRWRSPATPVAGNFQNPSPDGIAWQPWSSEAVAKARAEGHPVLVDFTAKWCITCNRIVKPALESSAVRKKLEEKKAVALLGDYTHFADNITEELNRFGRTGVPLVLVYPADASLPPAVYDVVTPGMVVDALDRATVGVKAAAPGTQLQRRPTDGSVGEVKTVNR
jgi:thiol:disulfide interchange protein DsbD